MYHFVRRLRAGLSAAALMVLPAAAPLVAQDRTRIAGVVVSEAGGLPIAGALVLLDAGPSVTADGDGAFTLVDVVPGHYRIAAVATGCHVGLGHVEVAPGPDLVVRLTVPLPPHAEERLARWNLGTRWEGSAVQSIGGDEIRRRNLRSVQDAVRLIAPDMVGQEASQPGGAQTLRGRGTPTVSGPRTPLIVLDGVRLTNLPAEALAAVNPADVERIEVVRGTAGSWRYGMQGANGVIIITTRDSRGDHPGDTPPEACGFAFPFPGRSDP